MGKLGLVTKGGGGAGTRLGVARGGATSSNGGCDRRCAWVNCVNGRCYWRRVDLQN